MVDLRMEGTSPSQASRELLGLRFSATECHDGEVKKPVFGQFLAAMGESAYGGRNRWAEEQLGFFQMRRGY